MLIFYACFNSLTLCRFIQDVAAHASEQHAADVETRKSVKPKPRRRIVKMESSEEDVSKRGKGKKKSTCTAVATNVKSKRATAVGTVLVRSDRVNCPVCMRLFAKRYMREHVKRHHSAYIKSPENITPSPAKRKADKIVSKAKKQLFVRRSTRKLKTL